MVHFYIYCHWLITNVWCTTLYYIQGTHTKICDRCVCGISNRYDGQDGISLESCKDICDNDYRCKGIEHWAGGTGSCYKCLTTNELSSYTSIWDAGFPSSVYTRKGNFPSHETNINHVQRNFIYVCIYI